MTTEVDFNTWKRQVDEVLESNTGLSSDCLVDIRYWDFWDAGWTPLQAAQEAVQAEWGINAPTLEEVNDEGGD